MQVKRDLIRRAPTEEEKNNLKYPKDKFDLISVDYVDEWTTVNNVKNANNRYDAKTYFGKASATHITVKCKKCGTVKKEATDREDMSCKIGPCNKRWIDLTGRRFGHLVVEGLELAKVQSKQRQRAWYWKCRCDCGRYDLKPSHSLLNLGYDRCHFCGRQDAIEKTRLPDGMSKWNRMVRIYKKNAAKFHREFTLSTEQFMDVAKQRCVYCGAEPELGSYGVVCNGVDRVDNSLGYVPGNVAACCSWCNVMKGKYDKKDFLEHVVKIADHCGLKFNDHPEREYPSSEGETGADRGEHTAEDMVCSAQQCAAGGNSGEVVATPPEQQG